MEMTGMHGGLSWMERARKSRAWVLAWSRRPPSALGQKVPEGERLDSRALHATVERRLGKFGPATFAGASGCVRGK